MLAAFRANVSKTAWQKGKLQWLTDPFDLLAATIEEMAEIIRDEHVDNKKKPAEVGRKVAACHGRRRRDRCRDVAQQASAAPAAVLRIGYLLAQRVSRSTPPHTVKIASRLDQSSCLSFPPSSGSVKRDQLCKALQKGREEITRQLVREVTQPTFNCRRASKQKKAPRQPVEESWRRKERGSKSVKLVDESSGGLGSAARSGESAL